MDKKKIIIAVSLISITVIILVVIGVLRKKSSYDDYVQDNSVTDIQTYDPSEEVTMLNKVLSVIDDYREELSLHGISYDTITEDMISYSANTSKVTVLFPFDNDFAQLWIHFNEDGSVMDYMITLPGNSDDDPGEGG